jgi:sterol O-acyltransferase
MLMIFLLFESFPNALAELTLFADREFYQDWWNATSIEELYSKWLRFSYLFFYRHVFMRLQLKFKCSQTVAKAITNLISATMQEMIMVST